MGIRVDGMYGWTGDLKVYLRKVRVSETSDGRIQNWKMASRSCLCSAGCCKAGRRPRPWGCRGRGISAGSPGRRHPRWLCSLVWCRRTAARSAGSWCRAPQSWTWLLLLDTMAVSDASDAGGSFSRLCRPGSARLSATVSLSGASPLSLCSTQVKVIPPRWLSLKRSRNVPGSLSLSRLRSISLLTKPMM